MIDMILYNANIITMNGAMPRASALAIQFGRIIAIGTDDDIRPLAHATTTSINLNGQTIIPGLTDAHLHTEWLSRALQAVDLFEVPSKEEAIRRVEIAAKNTPAGQWLTGRGWTQDLWGGEFPTAADLDAVSPDNPAVFNAKSGHAAWANTKALALAGVTASTTDPAGGEIVRDADGNPTGILLETAMELVRSSVPDPDSETLADYVYQAHQLMLACGITMVHDFDNPSVVRALGILRERGDLNVRTLKNINQNYLDAALTTGIRSGFGDDWIRFGGLKLFADGALGPRTALMVDAYEGQPNNKGIAIVEKDLMIELIGKASANGLASTVHAIGDLAVRHVLDAYEITRNAEAQNNIATSQLRHRIEHVQIIHPDDAQRLAELDIIASMQPIHATSDWQIATRYWGEERSEYAYNARLQIDSGAKIAFGSDAPVEPFEPFIGIHAAVARTRNGEPKGGWYPELKLTLDEALHGFTRGAAYAAYMEDHYGQLARGYLADLVVLDRDPYSLEPEALLAVGIKATMVEGTWRYGGVE